MNLIRLAIDASNISSGGGVTHLSALLRAAEPAMFGIERVFVWGPSRTLGQLPDAPWLVKVFEPMLERSLPFRVLWQQNILGRVMIHSSCDLLFAPGGTLPLKLHTPGVVMSRNMLPFEPKEAARFGVGGAMWLKMKLLRVAQAGSLRRANGIIFLSDYAKTTITGLLGGFSGAVQVISHGIEDRFFMAPRPQRECALFTDQHPFRFVYVSSVEPYKHQFEVAAAVASLRAGGLPVAVDFVGPGRAWPLARLQGELRRLDPSGRFIRWTGSVSHDQLHDVYAQANGFVFASSCENLPNTLLEAMASGLPIACSRLGPMPEVLNGGGAYFDPDSPTDISRALRSLFLDKPFRVRLAAEAHGRAREYTWRRCARHTFEFIAACSSAPVEDSGIQ